MTHPPLMIFAAGFGTRMGKLTRNNPKPLIKVAGRSLIDRCIDMGRDAGIPESRMVANAHYLGHKLADHLAPTPIQISHEIPQILDTGGGLRQARPLLMARDVLTANPDAVWSGPNPMELALQNWDAARMDALMICVPLARCVGRQGGGDLRLDDHGRVRFGGDHVYGGIHMLNTDRLTDIPDPVFSLVTLWKQLADEGRLFGLSYPGWWCDVGHPGGIAQAEELIARDPA